MWANAHVADRFFLILRHSAIPIFHTGSGVRGTIADGVLRRGSEALPVF